MRQQIVEYHHGHGQPSESLIGDQHDGESRAVLAAHASRAVDNHVRTTAKYTIAGGLAGKQRLDLLARICAPGTKALLDKAGIPAGSRCLDVGCGGGHVSCELARRVGDAGSVVGIDLDEVVLELARVDAIAKGVANVTFRRGDATRLDESSYDVVFARFLLSHVCDPPSVIRAFVRALKPGGLVVVEDTDIGGVICHPPSLAHDRFVELYRETVRRRGGNADLGRALPAALVDAGLDRVGIQVSQHLALAGEAKLIVPLTLARIADTVVAEGVASVDEVDRTITELYAHAADPTTLMGNTRVIQTWGRKPVAA